MNVLNLLTKLYAKLHNYPLVPYWVLTPFRKMVRNTANRVLPSYLAKRKEERIVHQAGVIISFTSFPARINDVWQVVESLKNQSYRPEKIILWLSKDQFPAKDTIPVSLWQEEDSLFEIRMVEGDIRSHKKFFYVMQKFPKKAFMTCDDDIYYHPDTLKHLVECSRLYPNCVVANVTRSIGYGENGEILPYNQWKSETPAYGSENLIQIGAGGVLYPPGTLHEMTLRKDLFFSLTPMADDIWLNCMARLKGTPVVQSGMRFLPLPIKSDSPKLSSTNKGKSMNDAQIRKLREYLIDNQLQDVYGADCQIKAMGGG